MWDAFRKWLHHLFYPHCDECESEKECKNCDLIRQLLEDERRNNQRLMTILTATETPVEHGHIDLTAYKPRKSRREILRTLEENSRAEAQTMRRHKEETDRIANLEKEAGIDEEADVTN